MAAALTFGGGSVSAQDYPTKQIRIIVGSPAGGNPDLVSRMFAEEMTKLFHLQVIVDNKVGASGNIASMDLARAPADGHTLMWSNIQQLAINPGLYKNLQFNADKDFAAVARIATLPLVATVNPKKVPATTLAEFVKQAKAAPGTMNYSSAGSGSPSHVAAELLKDKVGINLVHIPHKGSALSVNDLRGGQVEFTIETENLVAPHIKAGTLRGLAIMSKARSAIIPEVPSIVEAGYPGLVVEAWQGVVVPARTPQAVIDKLDQTLKDILGRKDIQSRLMERGIFPAYEGSAGFSDFMKSERARWKSVIDENKITAE
jgi:tripartite-type tricarboxylate transporter receptor subunit TctC